MIYADSLPTSPAPGHTSVRNRSVLLSQIIRVGCKIVAFIVLARLVAPADHGRFAMAASFTFFLLLFRDIGLGTASVQAPTLTASQLSALFGAHVALGIVLAVATTALAPFAAWFYAEPQLVPLLMTMSLTFIFSGIGGFPRAQLARTLQFTTLARAESIAAILATIAMIAAGALGAGAYSFAAFMLLSEAIATGLAWRAYGRGPRISADPSSLRPLFHMGAHVTGYQLVNQLLGSLDTFVVGQMFGSRVLGLYNRPAQLLAMTSQHVASPLMHVTFATLSRLAGEPARFAQQVRQTVIVTMHLSLPLATIGVAIPEETVRLVLGAQWAESTALLRWLAISAAANTLLVLAFGVNAAAGQARRLLVSAVVALPPIALAIMLGLRHGAVGVAAGMAVASLLLLGPRLWWMLRDTPVGVAEVGAALIGPVGANLAFGLGLAGGRLCMGNAAWLIKLGGALSGGALSLVLLFACWPRLRREARELLAHLPWYRRSET